MPLAIILPLFDALFVCYKNFNKAVFNLTWVVSREMSILKSQYCTSVYT